MGTISIRHRGSFNKLERFLATMNRGNLFREVSQLAQKGTDALREATPVDSGLAASSWYHVVDINYYNTSIRWCNDNIENGFPVALMLQLGHGTGSGGYVQGRDYINPAIQPVFEYIQNSVWKAVTSA